MNKQFSKWGIGLKGKMRDRSTIRGNVAKHKPRLESLPNWKFVMIWMPWGPNYTCRISRVMQIAPGPLRSGLYIELGVSEISSKPFSIPLVLIYATRFIANSNSNSGAFAGNISDLRKLLNIRYPSSHLYPKLHS